MDTVWMIWVNKTKSKSVKRDSYKSNLKSRRKRKLSFSRRNERRMNRCSLCREITLRCSRRSSLWEKSWKNWGANTRVPRLRLRIWLRSISNRNPSCWISSEVRRRLSNSVIKSCKFCSAKMSYTNCIRDPAGMMSEVTGRFLCLRSIRKPKI